MWMEPDRILVGEVRGPEALDLLMSWNNGHEGGIATLHANNVAAGLTRLSTLVRMHRDAPREIEPLIRRSGRYRCPYRQNREGPRRRTPRERGVFRGLR